MATAQTLREGFVANILVIVLSSRSVNAGLRRLVHHRRRVRRHRRRWGA